jgi:hypothetical protein
MKKMKLKILLMALLIILLAEVSLGADLATKEGEFWKGTCSCTCSGVGDLNASAVYKAGFLEDPATASTKAINLCHEQCARNCGGFTNCSFDNDAECTTCCQPFCASLGDAVDKCGLSCSSTCAYRGLVDSIVQIIYYAAGVLGALMIIINGIRIVTSQDPNERTAAKNGIIYVIIALIIIILAATLVNLFMNSATTPQT